MTNYLVFDTETASETAQQEIFLAGAGIAELQGYQFADGELKGKAGGQIRGDSAGTVRWAQPRQRPDGKWIIPHPERHPMAQSELPGGVKYVDHVMGQVTQSFTVESWSETWFPPPESP